MRPLPALIAAAAVVGAAGDCAAGCKRHRRLHPTDGSCAEACIAPETTCCTSDGACSREIFVRQARLEPGRCTHVGWNKRTRSTTTMAEVQDAWRQTWNISDKAAGATVCQAFLTLQFDKFNRQADTEPRQCYPYHRVNGSTCSEACMQDNWNVRGAGLCPLWKIIQLSKMHKGTCESAGYVVDQRRSEEDDLGECGPVEYDFFSRAESERRFMQPGDELENDTATDTVNSGLPPLPLGPPPSLSSLQ